MMWWRGFQGPIEGLNWIWMGLGMVIHLLFWVAVFYLIVRLVRSNSSTTDLHRRPTETSYMSAEEILRQRYAKGEIDRDQFKEMSEELKGQ